MVPPHLLIPHSAAAAIDTPGSVLGNLKLLSSLGLSGIHAAAELSQRAVASLASTAGHLLSGAATLTASSVNAANREIAQAAAQGASLIARFSALVH